MSLVAQMPMSHTYAVFLPPPQHILMSHQDFHM